jgi:NAD(P)-dependent dehydrogenase (short-subunit alcohol dehydrogenase family)
LLVRIDMVEASMGEKLWERAEAAPSGRGSSAFTEDLRALHDRVVVLTGACCGVGLAAAHRLARAGAAVVLAGPCHHLRDIASEIDVSGGDAFCRVGDVTALAAAERLARFAIDVYGRIDAWVNVAEAHAGDTDTDKLAAIARRHWGIVNGSLVAVWNMRGAGGTILNVATRTPSVLHGSASASFTRVLQRSVAEEALPIRVQALEANGKPIEEIAGDILARIVAARQTSAAEWLPREAA